MKARCLIAGILLTGCAASSNRPSPSSAPIPAPPGVATTALFLDRALTGSDLVARYPQRAKIIHAGGRYGSRDAAAEHPPSRRLLLPAVVLEDAAGARVRMLCEGESYRVASWVDRADLATVTRVPATVVARLPASVATAAAAPAVYLPAGSIVDSVEIVDDRTLRARVHGLFFRAEGLIARELVGATYQEAAGPLGPAPSSDGEILHAVTLLDAPGGAAVASVGKPDGTANTLYVSKLEARADGWTLVRYDEASASIVGWVAASDIQWFAAPVAPGSLGYGSGGGRGRPGRTIPLSPGTLLLGADGSEPLGVVLGAAEFPLASDSSDSVPIVTLDACGGPFRAQVRPVAAPDFANTP